MNRFVHRLPVRTKYSNLIMKRGVVRTNIAARRLAVDSSFAGNFAASFVDPRTIVIMLLDDVAATDRRLDPVRRLSACPGIIRPLNSTGNDVLIETIELSYATLPAQDLHLP